MSYPIIPASEYVPLITFDNNYITYPKIDPIIYHQYLSTDNCIICNTKLFDTTEVCFTNCNHMFHVNCLAKTSINQCSTCLNKEVLSINIGKISFEEFDKQRQRTTRLS